MSLFLESHPQGYNFNLSDLQQSMQNLLSALPYANRHYELSLINDSTTWLGHRILYYIESIPIIGAIIGICERILFYAYTTFPNINFNQPVSSVLGYFQANSRKIEILRRALSHPIIAQLYENACQVPTQPPLFCRQLDIVFVPKVTSETNPEYHFPAAFDYKQRTIFIRESLTDDLALSYFVFELNNVLQYSKFQTLERELQCGFINCETYVKSCEMIEHQSAISHHKIMQIVIKEMGWDPSMDIYAEHCPGFTLAWQYYIQNSHHANYLRHISQKIAQGAFQV